MPRGDGTGPRGFGQMTGRAAGYCAGFPMPGCMNPRPGGRGPGFGRGRGRGRGLGRGPMYGRPGRAGWMQYCHPGWAVPAYRPEASYPHPVFQGVPPYGAPYPGYGPEYEAEATTAQEVSFLKEQAALLKEELEAVQERLEQLCKQETGDVGKDKQDT